MSLPHFRLLHPSHHCPRVGPHDLLTCSWVSLLCTHFLYNPLLPSVTPTLQGKAPVPWNDLEALGLRVACPVCTWVMGEPLSFSSSFPPVLSSSPGGMGCSQLQVCVVLDAFFISNL